MYLNSGGAAGVGAEIILLLLLSSFGKILWHVALFLLFFFVYFVKVSGGRWTFHAKRLKIITASTLIIITFPLPQYCRVMIPYSITVPVFLAPKNRWCKKKNLLL